MPFFVTRILVYLWRAYNHLKEKLWTSFKVFHNNTYINWGLFSISDIQEFYELTLLDDSKSIQQKTAETLQIATKWEKDGQAVKIADVSRILGDFTLLHRTRMLQMQDLKLFLGEMWMNLYPQLDNMSLPD